MPNPIANIDDLAKEGEQVNGILANRSNYAEQVAGEQSKGVAMGTMDAITQYAWPTMPYAASMETVLDLMYAYEQKQPLQIECEGTDLETNAEYKLAVNESSESAYDSRIFGITSTDIADWCSGASRNPYYGNNDFDDDSATDDSEEDEVTALWMETLGFNANDLADFETYLRCRTYQRFIERDAERTRLVNQQSSVRADSELQLQNRNIYLRPLRPLQTDDSDQETRYGYIYQVLRESPEVLQTECVEVEQPYLDIRGVRYYYQRNGEERDEDVERSLRRAQHSCTLNIVPCPDNSVSDAN